MAACGFDFILSPHGFSRMHTRVLGNKNFLFRSYRRAKNNIILRAVPSRKFPTAGTSQRQSEARFKEIIETLVNRVDLSEDEAEKSVDFLLNDADEALISAFLVLLTAKGETYEEIVGMARAMFKCCRKVEGVNNGVDIVGTGGDGANTVNISTGASILAAAAGVSVFKQGNLSSSSACGSADVLEALGVNINLDPEEVNICVQEAGIGFMMAPQP